MRSFFFVFSLILVAAFTPTFISAAETPKENFPIAEIKSALTPYGKQVGFSVRRLDSEDEIVQVFGHDGFHPASVAKMISSACSLSNLGAAYQFQTIFGYTGSIKNGVLEGNLVIQGSGDPSFIIEDLKEVIEKLYVLYGIQEIHGDLIFDSSFLSERELSIAEGFEGDQGRSFTSKLTAIPLDFNSFSTWIAPLNHQTRIAILPKEAFSPKTIAQVKVISGREEATSIDYDPEAPRVSVSGKMGEDAEPKAFYRALPDPYASFANLVTRLFKEMGGKWQEPKKFKVETSAVKFNPLYVHRSKPLSRILMDVNKLSTNFGAELISLAAGASVRGRPTSFQKAQFALETCLRKFEINPEDLKLENASGLSRTSRVAPSVFTEFLAAQTDEEYFPEYLSSFSVLGRDGTMKRRLVQYAGRARLKTGTINGVRSLAGYVFPEKGPQLAFSLFFNCTNCPQNNSAEKIIETEDRILSLLLKK